jgi:hypothetical protein
VASLGSEVGRDGPAGGSPLVGLAGPLPTLSIYPLSITLGAPRRHSAATGATAAPPRAGSDRWLRIHPAKRNRQSYSAS